MFVSRYLSLVNMPKSVSCSSACCLLKLMMFHCHSLFNHLLFQALSKGKTCSSSPCSSSPYVLPLPLLPLISDLPLVVVEQPLSEDPLSIATLKLLCQLLDSHISLARADLATASVRSPMYGVVQSMCAVIEQGLSASNNVNCRRHFGGSVMSRIVLLCESLSDIVSPIVCSSSPEGFFPDTAGPRHKDTVEFSPVRLPSVSGNAQSLLLCCWHTMKEVSLLLGILVENFSHDQVVEDADAVLSEGQVS